jgi:predicted lactoylglutathione lyase
MFDHIYLHVNDLEASKAFYTSLLGTLGYKIVFTLGDGSGVHAYGKMFPRFWLSPASGDKQIPVSGPCHIAFSARNRAEVDAFHSAGLKAGAKCNGPPGVRTEYHRYYYAAFLHDLDGNNVECVCHMPPAALALTSWPVIVGGIGTIPFRDLVTLPSNSWRWLGEVSKILLEDYVFGRNVMSCRRDIVISTPWFRLTYCGNFIRGNRMVRWSYTYILSASTLKLSCFQRQLQNPAAARSRNIPCLIIDIVSNSHSDHSELAFVNF